MMDYFLISDKKKFGRGGRFWLGKDFIYNLYLSSLKPCVYK